MDSKAPKKPVVESKSVGGTLTLSERFKSLVAPPMKAAGDTVTTLKDVYTDILTKEGGGRWGNHAVTDNLIPTAIAGKGLEGQHKQDVQSYIGGYDFVSKYPESGDGAKVLAYAHQTRDIITKGAKVFLGKGLAGLLGVAREETRGFEGNVRGIEAAQRDLKTDALKPAEPFGHPSQELVEQAIREEEKKPKNKLIELMNDKSTGITPKDKQKMAEMAMNFVPAGGAVGMVKSSVDDVARAIERASWSTAQKEKWGLMGDDPLSFMEYQLASSQRSAAKFPEAKSIVKRWEEEIKEFKLANKIKD